MPGDIQCQKLLEIAKDYPGLYSYAITERYFSPYISFLWLHGILFVVKKKVFNKHCLENVFVLINDIIYSLSIIASLSEHVVAFYVFLVKRKRFSNKFLQRTFSFDIYLLTCMMSTKYHKLSPFFTQTAVLHVFL